MAAWLTRRTIVLGALAPGVLGAVGIALASHNGDTHSGSRRFVHVCACSTTGGIATS